MKTNFFNLLFLFTSITFAQNVYIPDSNFKNALLANSSINTNNDNEIQYQEASAFSGSINVNNKDIDDLTGIKAFVNLRLLNCGNNYIRNLDLFNNTRLEVLKCNQNRLESLDLSLNTSLRYLICDNNNLTSLDVSSNTSLIHLICNNNNLTSLDVSTNDLLRRLDCFDNNLTSLNLANGNNTLLSEMNATNNPNLSCIQIDANFDPPTRGDWYKDRAAYYNKDCTTINRSSLNEKEFNSSIKIYPNPVTNQLHIAINKFEIKDIEVYNILGNKVISTKNTILNVSSLPNGLYFLKLKRNNDLISTIKFIKKQ